MDCSDIEEDCCPSYDCNSCESRSPDDLPSTAPSPPIRHGGLDTPQRCNVCTRNPQIIVSRYPSRGQYECENKIDSIAHLSARVKYLSVASDDNAISADEGYHSANLTTKISESVQESSPDNLSSHNVTPHAQYALQDTDGDT